jgi:type VI secretion system protein ImpK
VLIEAPWDGRDSWNENALEREIFGDRLAFDQFYLKSKEASALPKKDALEVFYIAAVLGFRGIYRDSVRHAAEISDLGLPADLDSWAKQTSVAIQLGQGRPRIVDNSRPGDGAPALESKSLMVSYLLIGVILAAINSIILSMVLMKTVWAS